MSYSTGEIAALCGVSVRTVQFYDKEGLLKPEGYSEGGRRLYGEEGLKTLQLICIYRGLGLGLSDIKEVLTDEENSKKILLSVLKQRELSLEEEIAQKLSQRDGVRMIRKYLSEGRAMNRNSFCDIRLIMKGKKRWKRIIAALLAVGLVLDAAEIAFIVLWAVKGIWLPFAIGMPFVVVCMVVVVALYYHSVSYACVDCGTVFRPKLREWFFAKHTFSARKLTCPHCGKRNYQTETCK